MIIPEFLRDGDWIGVTAMSHPVDDPIEKYRFSHAVNKLARGGFGAVFTNNVFAEPDEFGRSGTGEEKAFEFNSLVREDRVRAIISAGGGEYLSEMLPFVDLKLFKRHPKWVQGYSDNTAILYYLTTKGDVATAYGCNFSDFGMEPWDESVMRGLDVLKGFTKVQCSFYTYQDGFAERKTGLEGYWADKEVKWKIASGESPVSIEGRLIGGCLDVILNIAGTPFDGTCEFLEKYKDDGIIWYLESFDLGCEQMMEGLWKMRQMGWFDNATGFVFGRPLFYKNESFDGTPLPSYEEVVLERLGDLNVPIILDADIGHKGPQMVMINGALARVEAFEDGSGKVTYIPSVHHD